MQPAYFLTQSLQENSWVKQVAVILGASFIISLLGPVSIPLPFTPVPIALQSHAILFLAVILGSKRAALAVLAFLLQGAMGLPVFAGAKSGMLHLAGPTGGYLFGYVLAAYVAGYLMERAKERTVKRAFFAMSMGNLAIYFLGLPWLSIYVGVQNALFLGMVPFIGGDFLKLILSLRALRAIRFFKP
jgi:biotin transport system substrate-specific component